MKKTRSQIFLNGFLYENPLFVLMLGVCPALAMTATAKSALAMGLVTSFVLVATNIMASALKRMIPESIRVPSHMVIIAGFVCITEYLLHAYFPAVYTTLGVYISLVAVNCLIFGRAESFACRNSILNSAIDGLGMGLGYTLALVILGCIRELLGAGSIFGMNLLGGKLAPMHVFTIAPGAFLALGFAAAGVNKLLKGRDRSKYANPCDACPSANICSKASLSHKKGGKHA